MIKKRKTLATKDTYDIDRLQEEIRSLTHQIKEQQLDERSKRTHLRDETIKTKAKAYNLLTEDIIEPLKISLSALKRDTPKVAVAVDHLEIIIETIENNLKWFKG